MKKTIAMLVCWFGLNGVAGAALLGPIGEPIISASFNADFAALVAHRFVGGIEVNKLLLTDAAGSVLDLSDELYGASELIDGDTPKINQGPTETGIFSVPITASFFPVLQTGSFGLSFLATDTDDGLFAIDFLSLRVVTTTLTLEAFIDANDGFKIGIPDNGALPAPLPISIPVDATGTGFDEAISSKSHEEVAQQIPEGQLEWLFGAGAFGLWLSRKRVRSR